MQKSSFATGVLLPTSTCKLTAQWQGPYQIVKPVGQVNYMVDMQNRRKQYRTFHVNMLRKWHTAVVTAYLSTDVTEESEEVLTWKEDKEEQPTLGSHLTQVQKADLMVLIDRYKGILCLIPGQTKLVEHHIDTPGARPIRLPAYRLPQAYRDLVKRELKEMAAYGIIEPS